MTLQHILLYYKLTIKMWKTWGAMCTLVNQEANLDESTWESRVEHRNTSLTGYCARSLVVCLARMTLELLRWLSQTLMFVQSLNSLTGWQTHRFWALGWNWDGRRGSCLEVETASAACHVRTITVCLRSRLNSLKTRLLRDCTYHSYCCF